MPAKWNKFSEICDFLFLISIFFLRLRILLLSQSTTKQLYVIPQWEARDSDRRVLNDVFPSFCFSQLSFWGLFLFWLEMDSQLYDYYGQQTPGYSHFQRTFSLSNLFDRFFSSTNDEPDAPTTRNGGKPIRDGNATSSNEQI